MSFYSCIKNPTEILLTYTFTSFYCLCNWIATWSYETKLKPSMFYITWHSFTVIHYLCGNVFRFSCLMDDDLDRLHLRRDEHFYRILSSNPFLQCWFQLKRAIINYYDLIIDGLKTSHAIDFYSTFSFQPFCFTYLRWEVSKESNRILKSRRVN